VSETFQKHKLDWATEYIEMRETARFSSGLLSVSTIPFLSSHGTERRSHFMQIIVLSGGITGRLSGVDFMVTSSVHWSLDNESGSSVFHNVKIVAMFGLSWVIVHVPIDTR